MNDIDKLQGMINKSKQIVFFGGAGVSTESGIPDFRSVNGLYNQKYNFPPEEILSHHFFINNTLEFYKFYRDKLNTLDKEPNICHKYLADLEKTGKLSMIITQNIDGLHEKAGSKNISLLHGTIYRNYCMNCFKKYSAKYVFNCKGVPTCECGGIIKPDVVLYEEALDDESITKAINSLKSADLLIIAGTSLTVYPASSFIHYFGGKNIVIINKDKTSMDNYVNLVIHENIGDVFAQLKLPNK